MNLHNRWPEAHDHALKVALDEGCSFRQAAMVVNDLFKTRYTRNSAIGRAGRIGLTQPTKVNLKPKRVRAQKQIKPPPPQMEPQKLTCEAVPMRTADVIPLNLTIYDLTAETCRWPYGEAPPLVYCGCPTLGAGPYCDAHTGLARSQGTRGEQMAARVGKIE